MASPQFSTGLARVAADHAELALPNRPKLVADVALFQTKGAIYAFGLADTVRLSGERLDHLCSVIFPHLSGGEKVEEIIAATDPEAESVIRDFLHLLHINGLIEEGAALPTESSLAHYFSRFLGITVRATSGGQAEDALRSATVLLPDAPAPLRRALEAAQVRIGTCVESAALWIAVAEGAPTGQGLPVLHIDFNRGLIGPLVIWGDTPCDHCASVSLGPRDGLGARDSELISQLAARQIQAWLSGVFRPEVIDGVLVLDDHSPIPQRLPVFRRADCPRCGDSTLGAAETAILTVHFATAVRRWMPHELAGFRWHIDPQVLALLEERAAPPLEPAPRFTGRFAQTLARTVGFRPRGPSGTLRRVIASAGNLGSAQLLCRDEAGAVRVYDGMQQALGPEDGTATSADFVVRSDFGKVSAKYGGRAVAYTLLDAGLCLSRLTRVLALEGVMPQIVAATTRRGDKREHLYPAAVHLNGAVDGVAGEFAAAEVLEATDPGLTLAHALDRAGGLVYRVERPAAWSLDQLDTLLDRRRSGGIRRAALDRATLTHLLTCLEDAAPWAAEIGLRVALSVEGVDGLPAGLYADTIDTVATKGPRMAALFADALLQREHAMGHVFVLLGCDIAGAVTRRGAVGYKLALMAAGWAIDNLCLAATEVKCPATPTGGFPPLVLRERLASAMGRYDPLIGFVIGGR